MSINFSGGQRAGVAIAVTTSSVASALHGDLALARAAADVSVDNRGAADAYIAFGGADVTVAVATGLRVPAGAIVVLGTGAATHVACISAAATSLVLHLGEGL